MTDSDRRLLLDLLAELERCATRREIHKLRRIFYAAVKLLLDQHRLVAAASTQQRSGRSRAAGNEHRAPISWRRALYPTNHRTVIGKRK